MSSVSDNTRAARKRFRSSAPDRENNESNGISFTTINLPAMQASSASTVFGMSRAAEYLNATTLKENNIEFRILQSSPANFSLHTKESGSSLFKEVSSTLEQSDAGFAVLAVLTVEQPFQQQMFEARQRMISIENDGQSNTKTLYHMTNPGNICRIAHEGLDPRQSRGGFFGRGLFFASDPLKANDYSPAKGCAASVRAMLRCRVVLGRARVFPTGHFDRQLTREPCGFHSVEGFIRRAPEYVVYSATQVLLTEIILYRFTNTAGELQSPTALPALGPGASTALITAPLSEFFSKLQARAGPAGSEKSVLVGRAIGDLLRRLCTAQQFVERMSAVLGAAPPPDLLAKLRTELERSQLPSPSPAPAPLDCQTPATDSHLDSPAPGKECIPAPSKECMS